MAEECIFCRIVAGEVPSDIVYQDEDCLKHLHTCSLYLKPILHLRLNLLRDNKSLPGAL